jgi:hypothetical protein
MVEEKKGEVGNEPFWRGSLRTGWTEAIKWGVVGVLGLVAAAAVWVMSWFATGGPARAFGALPVGAVVAFTKPCSSGWQNYTHAMGRSIVDANPPDTSVVNLDEKGQALTRRVLNKSGGAEGFTLEKDEIPPQDVVVSNSQGTKRILIENYAGRNAADTQPLVGYNNVPPPTPSPISIALKTDGKGEPHKYMPPYIVLYYCEKM